MDENVTIQTPGIETTISFGEEDLNLDGNSIQTTPDKLHTDALTSTSDLKLITGGLNLLDQGNVDFLGSSAKMLHKTISDYVDQHIAGPYNKHLLAQCSYDYASPRYKHRSHPDHRRGRMRQKPEDQPAPCAAQICRPDYKPPTSRPPLKRDSELDLLNDFGAATAKKQAVAFKATQRRDVQFKPSALTIVDTGPIKVRNIQRINPKPTPAKNEVKNNKSSELRYQYSRKQGSVPADLQKHVNQFHKPPFKRVWAKERCYDDIVDRLCKLKKLAPRPDEPTQNRAAQGASNAGDDAKAEKSRKPKKLRKPKATSA